MATNIVSKVGTHFLSCCKCRVISPVTQTLRPSVAILSNFRVARRNYSTEPLPTPAGQPNYPQHIVGLVDSISSLTLLEVSQLNELLKSTLNIKDVAMGVPMAAAAPVEVEEEVPVEVQTEFGIKILKFDATKKVKLIKEIKTVMTDMNLVQAKKFVESVPQMVKEKLSKEDADALKAQLEAVGAVVEIE